MVDEQSISVDDNEAVFIKSLQQLTDIIYVGKYTPEYISTDDMQSLSWSDSSVIAQFDVDIGFTLDQNHISALLLNLENKSNKVYNAIKNHIDKLVYLKELYLILPEDKKTFDLSLLKRLQYLHIVRSGDKSLEIPNLSAMKDLSVLVIDGKVSKIHESLGQAKELQRIIMRSTSLEEFPLFLTNLPNLVWLEFGNMFQKIPDEITKIDTLIIFDVLSDNLSYIPDDFGKLENLRYLSIETDKIDSLPKSFTNLQKLSDLHLWNFPFETIPDEILKLKSLKYLWMKENSKLEGRLKKIPEKISNLENLKGLELNGHQIESIPKSLVKLSNLEKLNLSFNQISELPEEIGQLYQLKKLELYYNNFTELPDSLEKLKKLEKLDISDNEVSSLPENIGNMWQLKELDAIGCPLEGLPESLTELDYKDFQTFMVSLVKPPKEILSNNLLEWLENLLNYANENEELGIQYEISLYEDTVNEEDEEILLEDEE